MNRALVVLLACSAATIALAGCSSSESSSNSTSSTSPATTATSTNASAATTKGSRPKTQTGGLKVDTTPKFAKPSSSQPVQSGIVQIAYRNIAIAPDTLRVKVGSTIKWTNYDNVQHNVTSEGGPSSFTSKNFGEEQTFQFKTTKPGTIHYECTNHPATMNGTIEVVN